MHGVRRPLLPLGLPRRQPDPGLERPRLPRPVQAGDRAAAPDEQLPRVHGPALPRALRGGLRARDRRGQRRHDQADRARDRRPRLGRGLDHAAASRAAHRPERRRRRLGTGGARGRAAAQPRRPPGRRLRARRGRRRAPPLRRPRLQDREVGRRAPARAARGRGCRVPLRRRRRPRPSTRSSCATSTTRSSWRRARGCRASCRCPDASSAASTSRWSTSTSATARSPAARRRSGRSRRRASTWS